jgi:hypothetical protein
MRKPGRGQDQKLHPPVQVLLTFIYTSRLYPIHDKIAFSMFRYNMNVSGWAGIIVYTR